MNPLFVDLGDAPKKFAAPGGEKRITARLRWGGDRVGKERRGDAEELIVASGEPTRFLCPRRAVH